MGRRGRRCRLDGTQHGTAAGTGRLFSARPRGAPCGLRHDGWQHGETEPAPGHDTVPDLPPAARRRRLPNTSPRINEALSWVNRYADEHGVARQERSAYTYATSESGQRAAEREMRVAESVGLPVSWTGTPELPFDTRGAVCLPGQSQLDPLQLLLALAGDVKAHHGTLVEGVRVRRIHGHGPVSVETDHGRTRADAVVVATNMPILDRGGFFARATAQRSYAAAFRVPQHLPRACTFRRIRRSARYAARRPHPTKAVGTCCWSGVTGTSPAGAGQRALGWPTW